TQPDVAAQALVTCPTCGAPGRPVTEATQAEERLAAQEMALQPTFMDQGGAAPATESNEWGTPATAVPDPLPETFGRYRIAKKLGRGGMGAVYLAQDTQLGRPVALKVPHFTNRDGPRVLERFYREARAAATINHPNICPVYDVGQINGVHYL